MEVWFESVFLLLGGRVRFRVKVGGVRVVFLTVWLWVPNSNICSIPGRILEQDSLTPTCSEINSSASYFAYMSVVNWTVESYIHY